MPTDPLNERFAITNELYRRFSEVCVEFKDRATTFEIIGALMMSVQTMCMFSLGVVVPEPDGEPETEEADAN